jgi:hypothetical protein
LKAKGSWPHAGSSPGGPVGGTSPSYVHSIGTSPGYFGPGADALAPTPSTKPEGVTLHAHLAAPAEVRIAIVLDNFSPHLSTKTDPRVGQWAAANNVELAYVPFYASWLNRIEAQFTALRYFALDGTDHESHRAQARMIRRYIAWRNRNAHDRALRELVKRANVA